MARARHDAFRRIDALVAVGLRLARSSPSGRIALARIASAIELEWIPLPWGEEVATELQGALDAIVPIEPRRVERTLREAWGAAPAEELDRFEPQAVAITPGAQVHRGELDGRPVAIKVLRPGLAASVRQDLVLLESLLAPLGAAFPRLNAGAIVRELRERILDELDLEHEAMIQRRFHRALRVHPFLTVPAPVMRLCHEEVLVSEWIEGVSLRQAPNRDQAAARLIVFAIGAATTGIVHADLHPDDVLVIADGRLAILDFGATGTIERERVELGAAVLDAFAEGNAGALGAALEQLDLLPAELGTTALELASHALGELAGAEPVPLDSAGVIAARDRLLARPGPLVELIEAGSLPPQDLWPARGVAQLFATIARAGARSPWRELVRLALRDGWDADPG